MLTKNDLAAIQAMFDSSRKETNERFESMDRKFENKIDGLADTVRKNTEELIELITTGFNSFEERVGKIEEKVFNTN